MRNITTMDTSNSPVATKVEPPVQQTNPIDLESLSLETGVPVDVLHTLAGISDPANVHMFTAEAAGGTFAAIAKTTPRAG